VSDLGQSGYRAIWQTGDRTSHLFLFFSLQGFSAYLYSFQRKRNSVQALPHTISLSFASNFQGFGRHLPHSRLISTYKYAIFPMHLCLFLAKKSPISGDRAIKRSGDRTSHPVLSFPIQDFSMYLYSFQIKRNSV
jgi:hypothetical protein